MKLRSGTVYNVPPPTQGVATLIARGEFMVCVDSDTFIFPGALQKLMQGFIDGLDAGRVMAAAEEAMALAITRAQQHGVCILGLHHSHHIGRVGHWAEQACRAGLIAIHFVNVLSSALVAPWGGRQARFGTNPFTIGVPVDGAPPLLLDFATSAIAMGKVRVAHNKGETLAPGILIDDQGQPSTDPGVMFREPHGALLPFGEHKGYGLAVACEILAGALTGGITLHGRPSPHAIINNMLSFIVDPERLGTAARLTQETRAFADWVTASPPMPGPVRSRSFSPTVF